jgi:hypothetical protein
MARRRYLFLRPTLVAIVLFVAALGIADAIFLRPQPAPDIRLGPGGLAGPDSQRLDLERIALPRPELPPADVVKLQVAGLSDASAGGLGILQCYVFASPANRQITGPLDRFGEMVRRPPFDGLARPRAVLVGRPQIQQDVARLLVTVVDHEDQIRAYAFVLSKQKMAPLKDCWMTDAVFPAWPWPDAAPPEPAGSTTQATIKSPPLAA